MATPFEQQSVVRVLIVEDNDAQRHLLTDLIRDEGFDPAACNNAAEALTQADRGLFGVAILDQRLPEMSGTELLGRLRAMQRGIQVIIHTSYGSFESARDAVNDAALEKYGYDRATFLSLKIEDIRPAEDIPRFREYIADVSETVQRVTQWKHQKRDETVLDVEVAAHDFPYRERPGRLVLANDITERKRLEKQILEISNREQRRIGQDLHDAGWTPSTSSSKGCPWRCAR